MRNITILILIVLSNFIIGQTRKFLVSDTNAIGVNIHREEIPDDPEPRQEFDTTYYFKENILKEGGHLIGYYDKGYTKTALEATFKDGKQIGYYDLWYPTGQKKSHSKETIFVKDFTFYDVTKWYPDNKIKHKTIYNEKDTATSIYLYRNGNIKMIEKEFYDTSYSHALYCYDERHFENGQLCYTPLTDNWYKKRQPVIFYFPNGKTKIICTMFLVEFIEKYEEWNNNGKLIVSGHYEDYRTLDVEMVHSWRRPSKVGLWQYFNDKGESTKEEQYNDKGDLIKTTEK